MKRMYLRTLTVVQFKNIREAVVELSPRLNAFIGNNGAGKTNFLDALYSLSFSKSFFNSSDQMSVTHGESWFMLQGRYEFDEMDDQVVYSWRSGEKKQLRRNGKSYRKFADHIGHFPLVMVSPSDATLILGGSDERRKFIDGVISQFNQNYLEELLRYNRVLMQRNTLLKQMVAGEKQDNGILGFYDGELVKTGTTLHRHRQEFIRELKPVFQSYYTSICGGNEEVGLQYQSDLNHNDFEQLLKESLAADKAAQHTTSGIHKDDLLLTLGGYSLKRTGSQGQQKSYLVALKLAQFEFIRQTTGKIPILLLDDIFDKLDTSRVEQIVRMVAGEGFGQIIITDTNRDHLDAILQKITPDYRIFRVDQGKVETIR